MSGGAPSEGRRRALHLASGSIGLAALYLPLAPGTVFIALLSLLALAILLEILRRVLPAFGATLERVSGGAMRPVESRRIAGATFLAFGYALAWWIAPGAAAARAILVTATADPAAAAAGTAGSGVHGPKTLRGSAAALVVALVVLVATGAGWQAAVVGAVAATLAERVSGPGLDNVALPVITAFLLTVIG